MSPLMSAPPAPGLPAGAEAPGDAAGALPPGAGADAAGVPSEAAQAATTSDRTTAIARPIERRVSIGCPPRARDRRADARRQGRGHAALLGEPSGSSADPGRWGPSRSLVRGAAVR